MIDRFFETKRDVVWTNAHPQFITVRVITPHSQRKQMLPREEKSVVSHFEKIPMQSTALIAAAYSNLCSTLPGGEIKIDVFDYDLA